jgi:hypothetical protein
VEDEMGAEELEGALGAKRGAGRFAQDGSPTQIVGRAVDGFLVRTGRFVLEEGEESELRGRDAGTTGAVGVESGEVGVLEKARSRGGKLAVEAVRVQFQAKDVADVKEIALGGTFSKHRLPPLAFGLPRDNFDTERTNSSAIFNGRGTTFRPRF